MTFFLSIATPETVTYDDEAYSVILPGNIGYMEILKDHASLISALNKGKVTVLTKNNEKLTFTISGGFFEVANNRAILLADAIEKSDIQTT